MLRCHLQILNIEMQLSDDLHGKDTLSCSYANLLCNNPISLMTGQG